jgi:carbonic anhydrase/acetyltransferase-like protein (isoleucine patch superfamily)
VLRAGPARAFTIGHKTNAQDNVVGRALEGDPSVGNRSTLAHHVTVRDSEIAEFAFVGFQAEIVNSVVCNGALVSAGARIENVTLPENALVPPGVQITTQEDADALELIGAGPRRSSRRPSSGSTASSPRGTSSSTRGRATTP